MRSLIFYSYSYLLFSSSFKGCGLCGTECIDYFTWTPGRWLPYTPLPLTLRVATPLPVHSWRSGLDYTALGEATEAALSQQYALQSAAEQQCRFNQLAAAVTGVTCSCPVSGGQNISAARECLVAQLTDEIPLGVAAPCGGSNTAVQATPFSLVFRPSSLTDGVCSEISVLTLSREVSCFVVWFFFPFTLPFRLIETHHL